MDTEKIEKNAIESALSEDWDMAIQLNNKLLSSGVKKPGVYNRLGKAYSEIKKWEMAIKSFEESLKLDPINSVAQKGLENAKNKRVVGVNSKQAHAETLIKDASTSQIIELHLNSPQADQKYFLVASKKPHYFLLVRSSDGKKIKRVSRNKLNLKSDANPEKIEAIIIELVTDNLVKVKLNSDRSIFKSEKQLIDPALEVKRKKILEEKKEIQKYFDEERGFDSE